jgi:threonine dehydratase
MDISFEAIEKAESRIRPYIIETPLLQSFKLQSLLKWQAPVFLKVETLQFTGSFKARGALNKLLSLIEKGEKPEHVVASSAGNHAQAVAFGASKLGIPATIVMPENAPLVKVKATEEYGPRVVLHGAIYDQAYEKALELLKETRNSVFVHPYQDQEVIAGQGTLGLELSRQLKEYGVNPSDCDFVIPIGGGGQFSGVSCALQSKFKSARFFGVVADAAPSMALSFQSKKLTIAESRVRTLAEGLAIKNPTQEMFGLISKYATDVSIVTDNDISWAIFLLMEKLKLIVEGAGAAGVASVLSGKSQADVRRPLVFSLCGGNIDLPRITNIIERGLIFEHRRLNLEIKIEDRPGELSQVTKVLGALRANVLEVSHDRLTSDCAPGQTVLRIHMETRGRDHQIEIIKAVSEAGYQVKATDS